MRLIDSMFQDVVEEKVRRRKSSPVASDLKSVGNGYEMTLVNNLIVRILPDAGNVPFMNFMRSKFHCKALPNVKKHCRAPISMTIRSWETWRHYFWDVTILKGIKVRYELNPHTGLSTIEILGVPRPTLNYLVGKILEGGILNRAALGLGSTRVVRGKSITYENS